MPARRAAGVRALSQALARAIHDRPPPPRHLGRSPPLRRSGMPGTCQGEVAVGDGGGGRGRSGEEAGRSSAVGQRFAVASTPSGKHATVPGSERGRVPAGRAKKKAIQSGDGLWHRTWRRRSRRVQTCTSRSRIAYRTRSVLVWMLSLFIRFCVWLSIVLCESFKTPATSLIDIPRAR